MSWPAGSPRLLGPTFRFGFVEPEPLSLRDVAGLFVDLGAVYSLVANASSSRWGWAPADLPTRMRDDRWPVPLEYQPFLRQARYESPLVLEVGVLTLVGTVPFLIRRWTAAIEDVADLTDRIRDNRGMRREERQKREEGEKERQFRDEEREHQRWIWERQRREAVGDDVEAWKRVARTGRAERELRDIVEYRQRELTPEIEERPELEITEAIQDPEAAISDLHEALKERHLFDDYENRKRRIHENPVQIVEAEVLEWTDED